ncbi:MAG: hypothetical protein AAFU85_00920 [Planctomycetota bacterium]
METSESTFFRLSCPECGRELELPLQADGKTAQCPACEHRFVAKRPQMEEQSISEAASDRSDAAASLLPIQRVPIETVVQRAQSVFSRRRKRLLWPFALPFLMLILFVGVPLIVLGEFYNTNPPAAMIWVAVLSPLFLLQVLYAVWFTLQRSNWVCDLDFDAAQELKKKRGPRELRFPDPVAFLKLGAVTTVLLIFVPVILIIAFTVAANLISGLFSATTELALILSGVVALLMAGCYGLLLARLWPLFPLTLQGGPIAFDTHRALKITRENQLTSFLIVVITSGLLGAGFGLLCVPLVITAPCAALLLVVAQRTLEGRDIPILDATHEEFDRFET